MSFVYVESTSGHPAEMEHDSVYEDHIAYSEPVRSRHDEPLVAWSVVVTRTKASRAQSDGTGVPSDEMWNLNITIRLQTTEQ